MFIAAAALQDDVPDKAQLLVLGLSRLNIERLMNGRPISIERGTHGIAVPANLKIMIFFGEDEASMKAMMAPLIGPDTVVDQKEPM
jgi:hypothetical protein